MYPTHHTVTRSVLSEHEAAVKRAGLVLDGTRAIREADSQYLAAIWPHLRRKLRSLPREEVAVLQGVVMCHKP
jgi:hypothetical protein